MKKFFALLLILTMAAGLTACAAKEEITAQPSDTTEPTETLAPEEVLAASESDAQAAGAGDERPASESDAAVNETAYEQAREYIGLSVEELYSALGEPAGGATYAASCNEEGAEDGMLFYDGFYVWTVRTESEEIIHDVYLG